MTAVEEALREAVGGVGYLARASGLNVELWEAWESKAKDALRTTRPIIGSRWVPTHQLFRDPVSGVYWEANSPLTPTEIQVQAALLPTPREHRRVGLLDMIFRRTQ